MQPKLGATLVLVLGLFNGASYAQPSASIQDNLPTVAVSSDVFNCDLRFWGEVTDNDSPYGGPGAIVPINAGPAPAVHSTPSESALSLMHGNGYTFDTSALIGAVRYSAGDVKKRSDGYLATEGFSTANTQLGETGLGASLEVDYAHLYKQDQSGKITEAYQSVCITGTLTKNYTLIAQTGCADVGSDPTAPNSGWQKVAVVNGLPALNFNSVIYVETSSGNGILKAACSTFDPNALSGNVVKPSPFKPHP